MSTMAFTEETIYRVAVNFRLNDIDINMRCNEYVTFTKEDDQDQVQQTLEFCLRIDKIEDFLEKHHV